MKLPPPAPPRPRTLFAVPCRSPLARFFPLPLLLLIAAAGPAAAAPRAADPAAATKNEARERFAQGLSLFEKGDNAAAMAEFKRAYELIPNPVVLYNIGLVFAAMNRPVEAFDTLDKFLTGGGASAGGDQARRATEVRDQQATRIARLQVVTNKPAAIEIDGVDAGQTPLQAPLRLSSGSHLVSAQAAGCLPSRQEVTLAGQVTETVTLTLLPTETSVAHLALTVSVPGAEVRINGKSVGSTPLPASLAIAPGAATIEVRRSGYRPVAREVRLDEGSSGALTLALEEDPAAPAALKGRLRLSASEPGAEVSIDGLSRPLDPSGLVLVAGPHLLRVQRAGFSELERTVEIAAGRDTTLIVSLAPTPETRVRYQESARARGLWGWSSVAAGGVLAVGAIVYAVSTRNDVSQAQSQLDGYLQHEATPGDHCDASPGNVGTYNSYMCGVRKADAQDQLSTARLRRDLAYAGIGLGVVAAAVGTYLVAGSHPEKYDQLTTSRVSLWTDGSGAGLIATGRF